MVTKRKLTDQIKENAVSWLVVAALGMMVGFMSDVGDAFVEQANTKTRIASLEARIKLLEPRTTRLEDHANRIDMVTEKRKQLTVCGARSIEAISREINVNLPQCGLFESAAAGGN